MYTHIYPDDITNIINDYYVTYIRHHISYILCIAVDQLLAHEEQINKVNNRLLKNKKQT